MATVINFFLGANSGAGFRSLFPQLLQGDTYDLVILKGCPGCGKSAFMERVGAAMEAAGTSVEYIRCAGDPDSLDAVLLPELRCAVADGTAPHVLEPVYPLAVQRCVDLGRFCDVTAAKEMTEQIVSAVDAAAAADRRATRALRAAGLLEEEVRDTVKQTLNTEKLARRVNGIAAKVFRYRGGESGRTAYRFLGGPTCCGDIWRFDSVTALCPRIWEFCDSFGLAGEALERLRRAAAEKGWNTIACLAPEEPGRIEHLLVPGCGVGFVTTRKGMSCSGISERRIRVDAMAAPRDNGRLRLTGKLIAQLRGEALEALREARAARVELEELYRPYVDFDGVQALAAVETSRLLSWMK